MLAISLFLLKPYIIAIASVAYRKDRSAIVELFYSDKMFISLEAAAAIPLLFLVYAWTRRSPDASSFTRKIWHIGKLLIITTAVLQLSITVSPIFLSGLAAMTKIAWAKLVLYIAVIVATWFSRYMADCFADFPASDDNSRQIP